jgi:hypothetical protein
MVQTGSGGPPILLSNEHRGLYPQGQSSRGLKLTTHLQLMPGEENIDLYVHSPVPLHGVIS